MNKLPVDNDARLHRPAGPASAKIAAARAAKARPSSDVFASIRTLGKTAMFAVEVVEIIGFGLALL
jgi:hypothetical protein